jgi:hypothetical protein
MKFFLLGILFTSLSLAGELKTSFSESPKGFEFSLYELSTPGETNRLWDFINSLYLSTEMNGMSISREYASTDKSFTLKCVQTYATKGVNEASCSGKSSTTMTTMFEGSPKFLSIILRGTIAEDFSTILIKQNGVISINLKDKFIITGTELYLEMQVKE